MSRAERFDRQDFDLADGEDEDREIVQTVAVGSSPAMEQELTDLGGRRHAWMRPINPTLITGLGESVLAKRPKKDRPHEGLDIFAPPGTRIYAASSGRVLRVRDGRASKQQKSRRAGLFVDVLSDPDEQGTQYIQRYLHLAAVRNLGKGPLALGSPLGELAAAHTSGLGPHTHLHFEVRMANSDGSYGPPLDPRRFLPPLSFA